MSDAACRSCGVILDGALANELAAMAGQLERASTGARFGGEGVGVRVKDPAYLVGLLRRAARATDSANRPRAA